MTLPQSEPIFEYDRSFQSILEDAQIERFKIFYDNYSVFGNEGILTVLKRNIFIRTLNNVNNPDHQTNKQFSKTTHDVIDDEILEDKNRLDDFKNFYLLHQYKFFHQSTNSVDVPGEIKIYSEQFHISLAKFIGYQLEDPEHNKIPCILTERPVNGSLSSYFHAILYQSSSSIDSSLYSSSDSDYYSFLDEHYTTKIEEFTPEQKYILIIGIVAGIQFLHSLNLVHARLNPSTVYIDEDLFPKLCGYGFISPENNLIDNDDDDDVFDFGTLNNVAFISPEILKGKGIYQSSDIFSIGMMIYYIILGIEPFNNAKNSAQIQIKICNGQMPQFPESSINSSWKKLILDCIQFQPTTRPTAKSILSQLFDDSDDSLLNSLCNGSPNFTPKQQQYLSHLKTNLKIDFQLQNCKYMDFIPDPTIIDEKTKIVLLEASKGNIESLAKLADYFFQGKHNCPKDNFIAFYFYKEASDLNHPISVKKVAEFYHEGIGVSKNLSKALEYYNKALNLFDDEIELQIINQKINEIKSEIDLPKSKESSKPSNIFKSDPEAEKLRENERMDIKRRQIRLVGLPSTIKEVDISRFFINYPNVIITLKHDAKNNFAFICFESIEDKKKFIKRRQRICETIFDHSVKVYNDEKGKERDLISFSPISKTRSKDKFLKKSKSHKDFIKEFHRKRKVPRVSSNEKPKPSYIINLDDYHPGPGRTEYELIGSGTFGDVYKAYNKKNEVFAAKVFKIVFKDPKEKKMFHRENDLLQSFIDNPLIVNYFGCNDYSLIKHGKNNATIIMEYMPNKTVASMIKDESENVANPHWNNTTKMKVILGVSRGMACLHDKNFIHRDLKPDNIFLDENYNPKIGDFGTSRKVDKMNEITMTLNVGTPIYMAPELLSGETKKYSWEVDIYSFGITMYQIFVGKIADEIYTKNETRSKYRFYKSVIAGKRPIIPKSFSLQLGSIIKCCWDSCINSRPSFKRIYDYLKEEFENGEPKAFFPDIDISEIRRYISYLDCII